VLKQHNPRRGAVARLLCVTIVARHPMFEDSPRVKCFFVRGLLLHGQLVDAAHDGEPKRSQPGQPIKQSVTPALLSYFGRIWLRIVPVCPLCSTMATLESFHPQIARHSCSETSVLRCNRTFAVVAPASKADSKDCCPICRSSRGKDAESICSTNPGVVSYISQA
jgi:hypothetical protein